MASRLLPWLAGLVLAGVLVAPPPARSADPARTADPKGPPDTGWQKPQADRIAARAAAVEADTQEALGLLRRMLAFLDRQQRFAFVVDAGYDAVQRTGQVLEFGRRSQVVVRRPDRMRVDREPRDGETASLFFDGQRISISIPAENAYVQVEKPGSLDRAIDYLELDLSEPLPLMDLIRTGIYSELESKVRYAFRVGEASVEGRRCDHVAFRSRDLDFQVWIEQGERPLPARIVITYKNAEGSPQFRARLTDWDLAAEAPDALFDFTPPDGAERIPFAALAPARPRAAGGR